MDEEVAALRCAICHVLENASSAIEALSDRINDRNYKGDILNTIQTLHQAQKDICISTDWDYINCFKKIRWGEIQ